MKKSLENALVNLDEHVKEARAEAKARLPFDADNFTYETALAAIADQEKKTQDTRKQEESLLPGLEIFGIAPPVHEDVAVTCVCRLLHEIPHLCIC